MIYLGLDDTDMLDTPGTNKLAMHLAELLADEYETLWIVRHQMLVDPRPLHANEWQRIVGP